MSTRTRIVSAALATTLSVAALAQQQQQPAAQQPGNNGGGAQPAPWRKFPSGLGGVPAGTAPSSPGPMLNRTPSRNQFPAQPAQPTQPAGTPTFTPGMNAGPGFIPGTTIPWSAYRNRAYFVVTSPTFTFNGRTYGGGDIGPYSNYGDGYGGLGTIQSGVFSSLGGALLRRYGGDTINFGTRFVNTPWYNDCSPGPRYLVPPPYRSPYFEWGDRWSSWDQDYWATRIIGTSMTDGFQVQAPPPETAPVPTPPKTTMQLAADALQRGDGSQAASLFQQRLHENDNDALAQRGLALALLEQRRVDQAVAVMGQTYAKYPWLAGLAISPDSLHGGEGGLRSRFNTVMTYANRTGTPSALLTAAVIAQTEGRAEVALKLVDRAEAAGLEKPVAAALRTGLGK